MFWRLLVSIFIIVIFDGSKALGLNIVSAAKGSTSYYSDSVFVLQITEKMNFASWVSRPSVG